MKSVKDINYQNFLTHCFNRARISDSKVIESLTKTLEQTNIKKFDEERTLHFIQVNKEFYKSR